MAPLNFSIEKKLDGTRARAGEISVAHGKIQTPAFVTVGTLGTVKALTPEQIKETGAEVVLANTYHLYLEPGDTRVKHLGGLNTMMHWDGPSMTDSGGFQVFSLGAAFGKTITKIAKGEEQETDVRPTIFDESVASQHGQLAIIDEEGVSFTSHRDGSLHRFTPERSIEIQHNIGADMIFAFDECTSPTESYEYQKEALDRTHRWAKRSIMAHKQNVDASMEQALFGIVQGGRFEDLRKESAQVISGMDFDGFGIGGSFDKTDLHTAVGWVNEILPEEKPRHLLGIGEPEDLWRAVEEGCDLFDCVAPTRMARNGGLYTRKGKINIGNSKFRDDLGPVDESCGCSTCTNYSRGYIAHLFRTNEMLGATLASVHNLYFIINLVKEMREAILDGTFTEKKESFLKEYKS